MSHPLRRMGCMQGVVRRSELKEFAGALADLTAGLDPAYVTPREAPGLWSALEDIRRIAAGAQLSIARVIDDSPAPREAGVKNAAEWIAKFSGESNRSGYEQMAASKRLENLPKVAAAVRRGDISVPQAQAIADAASCDPSAEERLVARAPEMSLKELREECLRVKAAADPDPD